MQSHVHPIDAVVRRTGLSAHVIRIWEKRYRAVEPMRTESNRRLYSEEQIERLLLLRDLTHAGQNIGAVARLPTEQLRRLPVAANFPAESREAAPADETWPDRLLKAALVAVHAMDSAGLDRILQRAGVALGTQGMLQRFAAPLARALGQLWRDGEITAAHEHFASAILRTYLAQASRAFAPTPHAPRLVVATPTGQLHEIGALLAGAVASNLGWHVIYLGASLPAVEIAGAARQQRAGAVALSLVYPDDDSDLPAELTRLRSLLEPHIALIAGGRAAVAYRPALEAIGAVLVTDLSGLGSALDRLRGAPRASARTAG